MFVIFIVNLTCSNCAQYMNTDNFFLVDLWLLYWCRSNFNRHYLSSSKLYWQKRKHLSEFCVVFITFRSLLLFSVRKMFLVASRSFSWRSCCFSSISRLWLPSSWSFSRLAWSLSPVFLTSRISEISCLTASSSSAVELSELLGHPPGTGRRKCEAAFLPQGFFPTVMLVYVHKAPLAISTGRRKIRLISPN